MHIFEDSIWINRSPGDVFDFHANHANRVTWHEHVTRSEMITPAPIAVGTRFEIAAETANRPTPMMLEITAYNPPGSYSYRSFAVNAITDSHQTFVAGNGGTRFQIRIELNFKGLHKPLGWLIFNFWLKKHFVEALRELKQELEK
jgi:hypothetical protein